MRRRTLLAAGCAVPNLARGGMDWRPVRPLRLVVPFPPGSALDLIARLLVREMEAMLGTAILIDNRGGAGGNIGADAVARSVPDGHTLLISSPGPLVLNQYLFPSMPFDAEAAFVPVALVATHPLLLLVAADRPERHLADLVTTARSGAHAHYATAGCGSAGHLAMEALKARLDLEEPNHVPFRAAAPSLEALAGRHVDFAMEGIVTARGFIAGGLARPLAVTTARRWPSLPQVPTLQEAGVAAYDFASWICFAYPAGVPEEAVRLLNAVTNAALAAPMLLERLHQVGAAPGGGTARQAAAHLRAERRKWAEAVRVAEICDA
jgi:tripartite-type tricarboxylate transporter receptor subunit TctC